MPPKNSVVRARDRARPSFSRSIVALGAAAPTAAAVSACGGGSSGSGSSVKDAFTQASQPAGSLTVWVDSTRVPAARAYQKAHPSVKLNIVTTTVARTARTLCRPRSTCMTVPAAAGRMSCSALRTTRQAGAVSAGFLAPLNEGLISQATLSNFATGSLNPCTVNRKVYCPRNDLGGPWLTVELPAPTRIALTPDMSLHTRAPSYDTPFGGDRLGRA